MNLEETLKKIPQDGFVKTTKPKRAPMSTSERATLIRKGNELFNAGHIELAKKIFITTAYGDGLSRLGDYYHNANDPLEALRMYWIAPAPHKMNMVLENITSVIQTWLADE